MTCSANSPSEFEKIVTNLLRPPFGLKATPDLKKNDAEAKDGAPPEAASVVCPREGLKFRIEPIIRCHDKPLNRLEVIRITGNVVKLFNGNEYIAMADECSVAHQASNLLHQISLSSTTHPAHHSHRIAIGAHPDLASSIAKWLLMSVDIDVPTTPFFHPDKHPPQNLEARFETFYK
ncbi:hypothetical protein PGT21_009863 [Puccinia graminis f. sp. tritici]|uniref:Uncharacterized protein n=1 Tax=Puccinia graminis f. sp. tritici TaxID=56615 RepID=A0A5B0ND99_PUCGR|nr:hypothetical protein PGT21_009863 [Puccinia graminis f. sp. tritici]